MENTGISSTGTNEVNNVPTFDNAVQQTYYPPAYNNSTNTYGPINMYERPQMQNMGDSAFGAQPYAPGTPTTMPSSLHPAPPPVLHPNPSTFSGYVASVPVTMPYAPQLPNQMYSMSDQGRAGSLPLSSSQSLDQYLTTPQSHLLQLRGTNPPNPPLQTNNFPAYGMPDRPQRFTAFSNLPFSTGPGVKQSTVGQIVEEDSSSAFREASSHINRKKRKACGRCGPCQRKDNCGTCMNCVNRAKGKQICIFRKCEELKKKPGTESYVSASMDHQIESATARQDKRKDLEQYFTERKRSRTEDSVGPVPQGTTPHQNFPGFTSTSLNFGQQTGLAAQSYTASATPHGTYQQQIQQSQSPHTSFRNAAGANQPAESAPGTTHTTDIISEALREIENNNGERADLTSVLNTTKEVAVNPSFGQHQQQQGYIAWNQTATETASSQDSPLLKSQLQGNVRLPGQPPPLPPGPGPGHTGNPQFPPTTQSGPASQALPDQLLSNLTRYNEFGSFQRAVSNPNQASKRPTGIRRPNYEEQPISAQAFSLNTTVNNLPSQPSGLTTTTIPVTSQLAANSQNSTTPGTPATSMYHNIPLTYGTHPTDTLSMQTIDAQTVNQLVSPQQHHPYSSPGNPNVPRAPIQNYQTAMPQSRFPNVRYQNTPQYDVHGRQMPVNRFHGDAPQMSSEYVQRQQSADQHFSNRVTSSPAVGIPALASHPTLGQGQFRTQVPQRAWDVPSYHHGTSQQSSPGMSQATGHPLTAKQEIFSPKQAQSALHSPVSSFSQESNDQSHIISQMPELAPSPISQSAGPDQGSQVKVELSGDPVQLSAVRTVNIPQQNINISQQTIQQNISTPNPNSIRYPPPGVPFLGNTSGVARQPYHAAMQNSHGLVSTTNGLVHDQHNGAAQPVHRYHYHQTKTAVGVYHAAQNVEGPTVPPPTSNHSVWQTGQQPDSSALPASVASQSDTNLTISPGESGYDSAEILHGAEDASSQRTSSRDTPQENQTVEAKEKKPVSEDPNSTNSVSNTNDIGSKNLYRAPVGEKAGSVVTNQAAAYYHLKSDLPSAGAYEALNNRQCILAASTKYKHPQNATSKRSFSYDDACFQTEEKEPVRLRRYSYQELSTDKEQTNLHHALPTSRSEDDVRFGKDLQNTKLLCDVNNNKIGPSAYIDGMQKQYTIPKPDVKPFTFYKNFDPTGQRRLVPFDTPPVTPRSADFTMRQPSIDGASDCSVPAHKIADILPTPPHTAETPGGKFPEDVKMADANGTSHRGYKVQNSDSSPSKTEFAACDCIEGTDGRSGDAPYYTHLGAAESVQGIRRLFEKRTRYTGPAIRIEKVIYTGKEGKTSRGCPLAKWIIRRSSEEEKVLIVCRQRPGHRCATAVIVVIILLWDGVARPLADFAYDNFTRYVPKHGEPTERRCATNDERTCACQGFDEATCGASFSFGCSWSMYYNGCKYARSNNPNKYKLTGTKDPEAERFVGMLCEKLATVMSPLYEMAAPDAFYNQVEFEDEGSECRLGEAGKKKCRPFSGVTSCLDFCAHSHKDQHNMDNGSTVVVTFTKPELRTIGAKRGGEQLHVLPLCKLDISNEQGNFQGVAEKISSGAIEILQRYRHEARIHKEPKLSKKQKSRAKRKLDSNDSPLNKRRGRPPKRCRSFENLFESSEMKNPRPTGNADGFQQISFSQASNQFHTPPRSQRIISTPNGPQSFLPPFQSPPYGPLSPTRWPYRRPVPPYGAEHNIVPPQINSPQIRTPRPPTPGQCATQDPSLNDNLPSIGNFFHKGAEPGNPQDGGAPTPGQPPQAAPGIVPTSDDHSKVLHPETPAPVNNQHPLTPLPSIKDVVTHPFHQNFAAVTPHPHTPQAGALSTGTPTPSDTAPDTSIRLKAYAAHNAPDAHMLGVMDGTAQARFQQTPDTSNQNEETVIYSDSEENFLDSEIGGVAVAPGHGSVLIECAKKELHATTALHRPNRFYPSRISLVFYQHKSMNTRNHGAAEYEAKEEERRRQKEEKKQEEILKARENAAANPINPHLLLPGMAPPFIRGHLTGQYPVSANCNPVWNPVHNGADSMQRFSVQSPLPNLTPNRSDLLYPHGLKSPSEASAPPRNPGDVNQARQVVMRQYAGVQHNLQSPGTNGTVRTPQPVLERTLQTHPGQGSPHSVYPYNSFSPLHDQITKHIYVASNQQQYSLPAYQQHRNISKMNPTQARLPTATPNVTYGVNPHVRPAHVTHLTQQMYRHPSVANYSASPHPSHLYSQNAPRLNYNQGVYPPLAHVPASRNTQGFGGENRAHPPPTYGTTTFDPSVKQ